MQIPKKAWIFLGVAAPVAIAGNLRGEWSFKPLVSVDSVTVGNAAWSAEPLMARAQRVDVRVDVASLFNGPVSLPEVILVGPQVLLERGADGHANWELPAGPSDIPVIGRLNIEDGVIRFLHPEFGKIGR